MSSRSLSSRELVAAISLTLLSAAAAAQGEGNGTLEEVVVTAQKREESLSDVPVAVSAISAVKIQESGINTFESLKNYVPSFNMTPAVTGNNIAIRGVASGVNNGFEQSVGTYVDGVYHGRSPQSRTPFLALDRVHALPASPTLPSATHHPH